MADPILPSDVTDPDKIFPTKPISSQDQQQQMPTGEKSFSSYMKATPKPQASESTQISPLSLMQQGKQVAATTPHPDTLLQQVNKLQETSNQLKSNLATPNLKLKASTKYLLKNKFSEANENLQGVNTKIGARAPEETGAPQMTGPFGKFVGYLNSGQQMMGAAKAQLEKIKSSGSHMSPSDFLLVQLKLNKAQQLLEFSSVLLSNAVSDIKQFMQVQI